VNGSHKQTLEAASKPPGWEPTIMVSSTVYGIENLLDQIYGTLDGYGYAVRMARRGTVFPNPTKSNFQNCLDAVDGCDLFLGIITPSYGSGKFTREKGITHQEMELALERKPWRWFLCDYRVDLARQLFKQFRTKGGCWKSSFRYESTPILEDLRLIDMYEAAAFPTGLKTKTSIRWVQTFFSDKEALQHVQTIFSDKKRIVELLQKGNPK
jgi:hypothetical protein